MAGGVTAEVQTVKLISKLLVINFVLKKTNESSTYMHQIFLKWAYLGLHNVQ